MRLFIAPETGTGYPVLVPLPEDEWYVIDDPDDPDFGTTVTETWVDDPVRPDVDLVHPSTATKFDRKGGTRDVFLVLDSRNSAPPANCEDLGDPEIQTGWDDPLSTAETNRVEDYLGQPRRTFRGWTLRQILVWMVEGDQWSQTVGDFTIVL